MKHKFFWVGQTGDEEFYEACDRHGVMVWQDFWLANPSDGPDAYFGLEPGRATLHSERGCTTTLLHVSLLPGEKRTVSIRFKAEDTGGEKPGLEYEVSL